MAKLLSNVAVHLSGLGVSVMIPEVYNYVAVDQTGAIWAYGEPPIYQEEEQWWFPQGSDAFIGGLVFDDSTEKELCKTKIWKVL